MRAQDLVRAATYPLPAGEVSRLEWFPMETVQARFDRFEIYMCETRVDALTANFADNYGGATPVLVYHRSSQIIDARKAVYWGVDFDTPFEYRGQGNLLLEVRWEGDDGKAVNTGAGAEPLYTFLAANSYNAEAGGMKLLLHRFRLTIEGTGVTPQSFGRLKSLWR